MTYNWRHAIRLYRAARHRELHQAREDYDEPEYSEECAEVFIDEEERQIRTIVMEGLEIGTIVKRKVSVRFAYHSKCGFVFEELDSGKMLRVRRHIS
jgi:hypothetical protein